MLIVSSCDQIYFPLVKGLFLSILSGLADRTDVAIGFVDIGCDQNALDWLKSHGVIIRTLNDIAMGPLADASFGPQRAQICRPFLPKIFPEARCIAWMDADMWVQDVPGVLDIMHSAQVERDYVFASPEFHFTYAKVTNFSKRALEVRSLNETFFDKDVADRMANVPVYNSGFVVASSDNAIWRVWEVYVEKIYLGNLNNYSGIALHFGEQVAFNYAAYEIGKIRPFDPLYNYLCLWLPPFRDSAGKVRLSASPHVAIGVLHLAGGWRFLGQTYMRARLLFQKGNYLTTEEAERLELASKISGRFFSRPIKS